MLNITRIDEDFAIAGQVAPQDLGEIAASGFRTLICTRPDGEGGPDQPAQSDIGAAARAAGLEFAYVPVVPGQIGPADVQQFRAALDALPGPVLGYCRTGRRAHTLYQFALQE